MIAVTGNDSVSVKVEIPVPGGPAHFVLPPVGIVRPVKLAEAPVLSFTVTSTTVPAGQPVSHANIGSSIEVNSVPWSELRTI